MVLKGEKILVTGGSGFLGSYVWKALADADVAAKDVILLSRTRCDLTRQREVERLFEDEKPTIVIHLAAEVGGIGANMANPAGMFYANAMMGLNVVEAAKRHGVQKLLMVGTTCSYLADCPVPFRERELFAGFPEATNAAYGIAKRSLLVMLQAYRLQYGFCGIYVIPTNLYGPGDNFEPETSHVIPAMIRKFTAAAGSDQVSLWGTGLPTRDFLYVADAAAGIVAALQGYDSPEPVNLGSGREIPICELAMLIAELTRFSGMIHWDTTRPDGQKRRLLDTSRAEKAFGFRATTPLKEGLTKTIEWWKTQKPVNQLTS